MARKKEIENIKVYCRKPKWTYNEDVDYEGMIRDASKAPTPSNLNFMDNPGVYFETKNEFNSIKILNHREGSSFYFEIGLEVGNKLIELQVRGDEIASVLYNGNMVNGDLIGNFKFVLSGSHTRLRVTGNQNAGQCKYWLQKYNKYNIFTEEESDGIVKLTEGSEDDINMALIMIEAKKSEYHKLKFSE